MLTELPDVIDNEELCELLPEEEQVIILKGSSIADDSVVGSGTVIAGQAFPVGSEIVGNPARILKEHINWTLDLV